MLSSGCFCFVAYWATAHHPHEASALCGWLGVFTIRRIYIFYFGTTKISSKNIATLINSVNNPKPIGNKTF